MNRTHHEPPEVFLPSGAIPSVVPTTAPASLAHKERSLTGEMAWVRLQEDLIGLGLAPRYREIGDKLPTMHCDLLDSTDKPVDSGLGKGIGLQCFLSAGFEALEHLLSATKSDLYNQATVVPAKALGSLLREWNNPQVKNLTAKLVEGTDVSCLPFFNLRHDNMPVFVPEFLINVDRIGINPKHYHRAGLPSLGTNNGTAIGSSFDEALLHALCEVIERDALSRFLLGTFVREKPQPIQTVEKTELPLRLANLAHQIEDESGAQVQIWEMTSDIEIPAYGASLKVPGRAIPSLGCGASINAQYALERALTEVLQGYHLWDREIETKNAENLARLAPWPQLQACATCDVDGLTSETSIHLKLQRDAETTSVCAQLDEVLGRLQAHNFTVLCAKHKELTSGTTCLRVVIPELEIFHLVRAGILVLPGSRGSRILQTT